jgi:hypothetical protein
MWRKDSIKNCFPNVFKEKVGSREPEDRSLTQNHMETTNSAKKNPIFDS